MQLRLGRSQRDRDRTRHAIIALLLLVLLVQLYILHVWLGVGSSGGSTNSASELQQSQRRRQGTVAAAPGCVDASAHPSLSSAQAALAVLDKFVAAAKLAPNVLSADPNARTVVAHGDKSGLVPRLIAREPDADASSNLPLVHQHELEPAHSRFYLTKHPTLYERLRLNLSAAWAADELEPGRYHDMSTEDRARRDKCNGWMQAYNVQVETGWGSMPKELHREFDELACAEIISQRLTAEFISNNTELYDRVWAVDPHRAVPYPDPPLSHRDVIAIIVTMTTRGLKIKDITKDLVLFTHLLPSLLRTVEQGFEYWFYLGYDHGDAVLDHAPTRQLIDQWFDANVAGPARRDKSIVIKLVWASFANKWKKPGPAFNYVCGVAYADGAEWIYRINDDQMFDTPWAHAFVNTLTALGPPYGVVGPDCPQGATYILIVDFVHRTHHDIFPTHYPPSLMAWFMDNWISAVYGRARTRRLMDVVVTHLLDSHGTRYGGVWQVSQFLRGEKLRARHMMDTYLAHTPGMEKQLAVYRADRFDFYP